MEPLPIQLAENTYRDYVCAACWGHLIKRNGPTNDTLIIECHRCGADTPGYVTKYYAERRRSESAVELLEVLRNLKNFLPNAHANRSSDQLISELGF